MERTGVTHQLTSPSSSLGLFWKGVFYSCVTLSPNSSELLEALKAFSQTPMYRWYPTRLMTPLNIYGDLFKSFWRTFFPLEQSHKFVLSLHNSILKYTSYTILFLKVLSGRSLKAICVYSFGSPFNQAIPDWSYGHTLAQLQKVLHVRKILISRPKGKRPIYCICRATMTYSLIANMLLTWINMIRCDLSVAVGHRWVSRF